MLNLFIILGILAQLSYSLMVISSLIAYHYGNKSFAALARVLCWIVGCMSIPAIMGYFSIINIAVAISCYRISKRTRPSLRWKQRKLEGREDILDSGL